MPQVKGCETIIRMEVPSVFKSGLFARSRSDRIVAGVAAGIAERLKIDPVVIRLAFVVLSFAGGLGIVVYLLAWLIVPDAHPWAKRRVVPPWRGSWRQRTAGVGSYRWALALSTSVVVCRSGDTSTIQRLRPCVAATISPAVG